MMMTKLSRAVTRFIELSHVGSREGTTLAVAFRLFTNATNCWYMIFSAFNPLACSLVASALDQAWIKTNGTHGNAIAQR